MNIEHENNKKAWEEVFEHRREDFGMDIIRRCQQESFPFLQPEFVKVISQYDLKGKKIAHFCCNNGRELMSLMQLEPSYAVGFDIAQNMIDFANEIANTLSYNCEFVQSDILAIQPKYNDTFDAVIITIGALTWFKDLQAFFQVVKRVLKEDGVVLLSESHPFTNMLAMPNEDGYVESQPDLLVNSYFKDDPWIEQGGIDYIADSNNKFIHTFTSYSHTLSSIFNSMISSGFSIQLFNEYEKDLTDSFEDVSNSGFPLSYVLVAQKK